MKVETLKETLSQALNIQSKALNNKSSIPILSNVLFKADSSKLYLYTTNLELTIISWIGAEVIKSGSTTVSLKRFLEYINTLPEGNISISYEENELFVVSKNNKANFNTISFEDYPKISEIKNDPICSINSMLFFSAVNSVVFSASKDDTKPTFTGIYIEIDKSSIDIVSIDGFRMTKRNIKTETGIASKMSFIIPSSYMEEIARLGGDKEEDIKIYLLEEKNQIGIRYKNIDFIIRLIEGNYPNYNRIIPDAFTTEIVVNRQELLDAVKISNIFSSQKEINKTEILIEENSILLSSSQKEIGNSESKIECKVKGDFGSISYNSRFLQDAVSHMTEEFILIRAVLNKDVPTMFYNVKDESFEFDDDYFHLMTPLQTKND